MLVCFHLSQDHEGVFSDVDSFFDDENSPVKSKDVKFNMHCLLLSLLGGALLLCLLSAK